jgi:hypothetical protein
MRGALLIPKLASRAVMVLAAAARMKLYRPRRAQESVVSDVVRSHLPQFIEQAAAGDFSLPAFVLGELEALLACGDPARGFTHLKCPRCGFDRFLPFSCKSRTICSSCAGRRMNETARFLINHVIADVRCAIGC